MIDKKDQKKLESWRRRVTDESTEAVLQALELLILMDIDNDECDY